MWLPTAVVVIKEIWRTCLRRKVWFLQCPNLPHYHFPYKSAFFVDLHNKYTIVDKRDFLINHRTYKYCFSLTCSCCSPSKRRPFKIMCRSSYSIVKICHAIHKSHAHTASQMTHGTTPWNITHRFHKIDDCSIYLSSVWWSLPQNTSTSRFPDFGASLQTLLNPEILSYLLYPVSPRIIIAID